MAEDEDYYLTTRTNLIREIGDPPAGSAVINEIGALPVERVLDIGCGIGQALFPLAVRNGAFGMGVDISDLSVRMGREFYAANLPEARVAFMNARAESLPFAAESFDLVNCGLALPYTHNRRALGEVARVLRPGGVFLLKIHHLRYYLRELKHGIMNANILSVIHAGRVLTAGTIYHLSQRQPMRSYLNESYQTRWLLRRELAKSGLLIERELLNTDPAAPAFLIRKASPDEPPKR